MTDARRSDSAEHWLVTPRDAAEWVTHDADQAEQLRSDPNCEIQGPFVLAGDWEKDNLCGVCPYRKAVQAENGRLRESLEHVANWKEFYDRNVGAWDAERYGRLTIGSYARAVLDAAMGWSR